MSEREIFNFAFVQRFSFKPENHHKIFKRICWSTSFRKLLSFNVREGGFKGTHLEDDSTKWHLAFQRNWKSHKVFFRVSFNQISREHRKESDPVIDTASSFTAEKRLKELFQLEYVLRSENNFCSPKHPRRDRRQRRRSNTGKKRFKNIWNLNKHETSKRGRSELARQKSVSFSGAEGKKTVDRGILNIIYVIRYTLSCFLGSTR